MLPLQEAWVQSLVGELRFHMAHSAAPCPPQKTPTNTSVTMARNTQGLRAETLCKIQIPNRDAEASRAMAHELRWAQKQAAT